MTDYPYDEPTEEIAQEASYVEEVVEFVDNRRQRVVLSSLFVVLVVLLGGISYFVLQLSRPDTAPTKEQVPEGITWVRSIYGWGKMPDQQLVSPTDVAVGPDGSIWCLSQHSAVVAFNPDGSPRTAFRPKVGASLEGISVAEDGDVWVADFAGQVIRFKPDGSVVTTYAVQLPNELDVKNGRIAVAASRGIAIFTPDDEVLLQFGSRGSGADQFDLPHGIVQTEEAVYVSDTQNKRVRAFAVDGRELWTLGVAPDRTKPNAGDFRSADTSAPFELPTGMTMDGNGRLVLVDAFKFQIIAVDAKTGRVPRDSAKHLARYGDQGSADGLFMFPTGIAYDKARDWFVVADTGNNRLQVLRIPDSGGGAVSRVAGAVTTPMWVFLIPLLLPVTALSTWALRRIRRQRLILQEGGLPM